MKKRKKNLFLAIAFMLAGAVSMAQSVTIEEARHAALNFLKGKSQTIQFDDPFNLTETRVELANNEPICYIFQLNHKGFIIVSADKNAPAILAYGDNGGENLSRLNQSFDFWLNDIKKELQDVLNDPLKKTKSHTEEWNNLLRNEPNQTAEKSGTAVVGPLTTSVWGQSGYYNDHTPPDGNTCPAGCVALGMSQAFNYYNHPVKGKNSVISYFHNTTYGPENTPLSYGTLSFDMRNTMYNWGDMPDTVTTPNSEVAKLIYHAGVAVKMKYKPIPNSSAAYYSDLGNALKNVFGYTSSGALYRSNFSPQAWLDLIKGDLNNKRIVIMCGNDYTLNAGHCFIVDGYDDENYLHINWGWNGSYNGYFLSTEISIRGYDFNGSNHIYRIYPTCYSNLSASNVTYNSVTITNTEYAQTNYFQYRKAGTSSWTTVSTTESALNLTGLSAATTYQYRDSIICSELGKVVSPFKTFTTTALPAYCPAYGKNTDYEWIQSVVIGTISSVSGKNSGYGNFTQLSTSAVKGDTVNYIFTPGYSSPYPEYWMAWIDFNQDGDLTDTTEQVVNTTPAVGTLNGSFVIPSSARSGNTRMRIMMSYYQHTNPCTNPSYGEVEDYTINITNTSEKMAEFTITPSIPPSFQMYPNPTSGILYIETEDLKTDAVISIKNMLGQTKYTKELLPSEIKSTESMDISHLSEGIYLVELVANGTRKTRPLVIK